MFYEKKMKLTAIKKRNSNKDKNYDRSKVWFPKNDGQNTKRFARRLSRSQNFIIFKLEEKWFD